MMLPIHILLNIHNLYADADGDARSMTQSKNTRSYTLRSVPSSPGRSLFQIAPWAVARVDLREGFEKLFAESVRTPPIRQAFLCKQGGNQHQHRLACTGRNTQSINRSNRNKCILA